MQAETSQIQETAQMDDLRLPLSTTKPNSPRGQCGFEFRMDDADRAHADSGAPVSMNIGSSLNED